MPAVVTLMLSASFGAGVQYVGSLPGHFLWGQPWMTDVSLLSAPWLLLPFLAGTTARSARAAGVLGFVGTYVALAGYALMTLSPVENAHLDAQTLRAFLVSNAYVFVGGLVTGPLFGWFGQQWRTRRAWRGALIVAAALALEPLARIPVDRPLRSTSVVAVETTLGVLIAAYVVVRVRAASDVSPG